MNFLGHLYLSGNEPLVIVGNFMADAVKGRDCTHLHPDVQRGIALHRAIDSVTMAPPGRFGALPGHASRLYELHGNLNDIAREPARAAAILKGWSRSMPQSTGRPWTISPGGR